MTVPARSGPGRRGRPVHPPAAARHLVQVMLGHRRGDQRDVDQLVRGRHAQVRRAGQVRAARARPLREMRHRLVRVLAPGQVRARRAGLLARLAPFPFPRFGLAGGGVRPGRSSADGGIEEFPLFRDTSRSSRSTLAARSATCPASRAFSAASISITRACTVITASRAASSGIEGTDHHDQDNLVVIKPARWSRPGKDHRPLAGGQPVRPECRARSHAQIALPVPARGCWVIP